MSEHRREKKSEKRNGRREREKRERRCSDAKSNLQKEDK